MPHTVNFLSHRRALRDGEREEVTIGHSIGNKTHFVEKKRDKDGRVRQQQKFVNLREGIALFLHQPVLGSIF